MNAEVDWNECRAGTREQIGNAKENRRRELSRKPVGVTTLREFRVEGTSGESKTDFAVEFTTGDCDDLERVTSITICRQWRVFVGDQLLNHVEDFRPPSD
jgi:hypothetical protein